MLTLQEYSLSEYKYTELLVERDNKFDVRTKWENFKPDFDIILNKIEPIVSYMDEDARNYSVLFIRNDVVVLLDFDKKTIAASLSSNSKKQIEIEIDWLKQVYPPEPDLIDGKAKVRFWYSTSSGPKNVLRTISVPKWETIEKNYDEETLKGLRYLIDDFKPSGGGQLLIMNGIPGTGKSYYLRSLLHSWKDWCSAEYVLDPENLFSGGPGYLADLVLKNTYDEEFDFIEDEAPGTAKWKLLILEDSGELLQVDAKERIGQGLSRLLNLVDGLIGQGLRVLVLITTNEEFSKMHPAVIRDGRTAAAITFNPLTREKASTWLNGSAPILPAGKTHFTLAELYALTSKKSVKVLEKESSNFGFVMR